MTQTSLLFQPHSETSRAAAQSMEPVAGTLRWRVLTVLRNPKINGATDEELQECLTMSASTERPRRIELVRAGLVRDSGRTRPGRSGRQMTVWVAV